MKKFLTVLLVIAVMFTFSFGSAFAAVESTDAKLIEKAADYAKANLAETYAKAYAVVLAKTDATNSYITKAAWEAATDDAVVAMGDVVDLFAQIYIGSGVTGDNASTWNLYPTDLAYTAKQLFAGVADYIAMAEELDKNDNGVAVLAAQEQFKIDYAKAVAMYDKIDVDALYSKTTPTSANSYYKAAVAAIEESKEALEAFFFTAGKVDSRFATVSALATASSDVATWVTTGIDNEYIDTVTGVGKVTWSENTTAVKYYYLLDESIKMMEQEAAKDTLDAAKTAALKAKIAQNVANFMTDSRKASPSADHTKQEWVDIYTEIYGYVAEELPDELEEAGVLDTALESFTKQQIVNRETEIENIAALEAYAAKVAAEKDENGVVIRDAEDIADLVEAAKLDRYAAAIGVAFEDDENAYNSVYRDIVALDVSIEGAAAKLAFDKEALKAELADEVADFVGYGVRFYDLEMEAVKAEYEKAYAAIDAAKKASELTDINAALDKAVNKIDEQGDVNGLFGSGKMAVELSTQVTALKNYVAYANTLVKSYDDAHIAIENLNDNELSELVRDYYIEAGARTAAEMKAMTGVVEAVADSIPTLGELEAAEKAAKDAVKALPAVAKITAADKDAIKAAYEAIEAYKDLYEIADVAVDADIEIEAEIQALYDEMQSDLYAAYAKADKTDKSALLAIKADRDALNKELYSKYNDNVFTATKEQKLVDVTEAARGKIKNAEFAAVEKAINAIPVNVTEADIAAVEAARELYDAYVAEYTNIYNKTTGFVADDFTNLIDLIRAEAVLGLNVEDEAYSVEALKITASSKATKGAITVKWTVEGDTDAVEGYEIWKSTKKNSGYKKAFTATKMSYKNTKGLKKGTRYFYKVRAIAYTAEGEKVKSDWSNKAYRVAK